MTNSKLGTKRTCPTCEGKFYDLNKSPIICPLCNKEFRLEDIIKKRGEAKVSAKDMDMDMEDDIIVGGMDDDLVGDASDLGEDADDLGEVMDNIERSDDE